MVCDVITANLFSILAGISRSFFFFKQGKEKILPHIMKKEAAHPPKQGAINSCKGTTRERPLILGIGDNQIYLRYQQKLTPFYSMESLGHYAGGT